MALSPGATQVPEEMTHSPSDIPAHWSWSVQRSTYTFSPSSLQAMNRTQFSMRQINLASEAMAALIGGGAVKEDGGGKSAKADPKILQERLQFLVENITYEVFNYARRGLFEPARERAAWRSDDTLGASPRICRAK